MKKQLFTTLIIICFSFISFGQELNKFINSYFDQTLGNNVGGYSYVIYKDGKLVADGGNGIAIPNSEHPVIMSSDTRMQIASCSKTITAIALLKLLDKKNISIDTTLGDLLINKFPKMSKKTKRITLKNLLNHTSGYNFGYLNTPHIESLTALFNIDPPNLGNTYTYSNINYGIIRYVIEYLSNTNYEKFVKENVLNLFKNTMSLSPDGTESYTYSFPHLESAPLNIDFTDTDNYYAAAYGWYASARELSEMGNLLLNNRLMSKELTAQMLSQKLGVYNSKNTSLGNIYSHEGLWIIPGGKGIRTILLLAPEENIVSVLFINTNIPMNMNRIMVKILEYCSLFSREVYNKYPRSEASEVYLYIEKPITVDEIRYSIFNADNNVIESKTVEAPIIIKTNHRIEYQGFKNSEPVTFKINKRF